MPDDRPTAQKKTTKRRRGALLATWLTTSELDQVKATAAEHDKTVSEYVRDLVLTTRSA